MTRIPFWPLDARPTLTAIIALVAATGCPQEPERDQPPELLITPQSALQGDVLDVYLSAEGVPFDGCDHFTPDSLTFQAPTSTSRVTVYKNEFVPPDRVHAHISVDGEAETGEYEVVLVCTMMTKLRGKFVVRARSATPTLNVEPATGAAGDPNLQVTITADRLVFDESTYVLFGDGEDIVVRSQKLIPTAHSELSKQLELTISIDSLTPEKEFDLAVITGSQVIHEKFEVTDRIEPKIWVSPESVERPRASESEKNYTLTIQGENVYFVRPSVDAGVDDPNASKVSFPRGDLNEDAPGIEVTKVDVESLDQILVNILVYDYASLGATRLRVTTGDVVVETTFSILLAEGALSVQLFPNNVTRGCHKFPILAAAINYTFKSPLGIRCLEETSGCQVDHWFAPLPSKQVFFGLSLDHDFPASSVKLEFTSDEGEEEVVLTTTLSATNAEGLTLGEPKFNLLTQGQRSAGVELMLEGGVFDDEAAAHVLPRSGVRIVSQTIDVNNREKMTLLLDVADDAPTGPVLIQVETGGVNLEQTLRIVPSHLVPSIELQPEWIIQGRRVDSIEVTSYGFELSEEESQFFFDDPAILIKDVEFDSDNPNWANVEFELSPAARADISVLYVRTGDDQAAGTFQILDTKLHQAAQVTPSKVARGESALVTVRTPGRVFKQNLIAEVSDDIGVTVSTPQRDPSDSQEISFTVEAAASGPGGWIGVVVDSLIVPIEIEAADMDALTMKAIPASVITGSRAQEITVIAPTQIELYPLSEAYTGTANAYVSALEVTSASTAKLTLDVGFNAEPPGQKIRVFITGIKGAAVGDVMVNQPALSTIDEISGWYKPLAQFYRVSPGPPPTMVIVSNGNPDRADFTLDLISSNWLDTEGSVNPDSAWITEDREHVAVAAPIGSTDGMSSDIRIISFGDEIVDLAEDPGSTAAEWDLAIDPCQQPLLAGGNIDTSFDIDRIAITQTNCRLAAVAISREMADRAWSTPDLWMSLWDENSSPISGYFSRGWPTAARSDPRLFLEAGLTDVEIALGAELASNGLYMVNLRRPTTIREFCRALATPYVEIEVEPNTSLDDLTLELYDIDTGLVIESLSFAGVAALADGIILISTEPVAGVDIVHPVALLPEDKGFALRLIRLGQVVDAVQVGTGVYQLGEGDPLGEVGAPPIFARILGIDTDDNTRDFLGKWLGTPGQ